MLIEQTLMLSLKRPGGLTRGRGMHEIQRLIWIMSKPACSEVNDVIQNLTSVSYTTSNQHKEAGCSRKERDLKDTREIIRFLKDRSPFENTESLYNIVTGVTAGPKVNVDRAEIIGKDTVASMVDQNVFEFSFQRKNQATNMQTTGVVIGEETINIDPQVLFQRLIAIKDHHDYSSELFEYELCGYPPALFDRYELPREANKPQIADAVWEVTKSVQTKVPSDKTHFVIDGGALLQQIPWQHGVTYDHICKTYVQYVERHYGKQVTIVFDSYQHGPLTKDPIHQRRKIRGVGPKVKLQSSAVISHKKDIFLSNDSNTQNFILMFAEKFSLCGFFVHHAHADADLLTVRTALECAQSRSTVVIGDDTDLLILLCYHNDLQSPFSVYLKPQPQKRQQQVTNMEHQTHSRKIRHRHM